MTCLAVCYIVIANHKIIMTINFDLKLAVNFPDFKKCSMLHVEHRARLYRNNNYKKWVSLEHIKTFVTTQSCMPDGNILVGWGGGGGGGIVHSAHRENVPSMQPACHVDLHVQVRSTGHTWARP